MTPTHALGNRHRHLQHTTRKLASDLLSDAYAVSWALPNPQERFLATQPYYAEMVNAGLLKQCISVEAGGECAGYMDLAVVAEELFAVDASVSLTLLSTVLGLTPLVLAGTPEQRARLLPSFLEARGTPLAAFASSEPGGSANAGAAPPAEGVRTRARREGDEWVISGSKQWISSAGGWDELGADLTTVVCRTGDASSPSRGVSVLAVPRTPEGFKVDRHFETLGLRSHSLPRVTFDGLRTRHDNLVGTENAGLSLVSASFGGFAAIVGIFGVGLMRSAFDHALFFARHERRGGVQPIIEHQAVGHALAEAKMFIEAARSLCWRACQAMDDRQPGATELGVQAKIFGSETAIQVIGRLMNVIGVDSFNHDLPLARLLQDAYVLPLIAGGNLGVRRGQLHALLRDPGYDTFATIGGAA